MRYETVCREDDPDYFERRSRDRGCAPPSAAPGATGLPRNARTAACLAEAEIFGALLGHLRDSTRAIVDGRASPFVKVLAEPGQRVAR